MNIKTIFEIPIYSMTEKSFNEKWKKIKQEEYDYVRKGKELDLERKRILDDSNFPMCVWKYNQIIGYIVISIQNRDIVFDIFSCTEKKYMAKSKRKKFMQNWYINGMQLLSTTLTEKKKKKKILDYLKIIENEELNSKFYIDYSTFNNIFPYINITEIIKTINNL